MIDFIGIGDDLGLELALEIWDLEEEIQDLQT